jgi:hypothetical protein
VSCDVAIWVGTSNQAIKDPWLLGNRGGGAFEILAEAKIRRFFEEKRARCFRPFVVPKINPFWLVIYYVALWLRALALGLASPFPTPRCF